MAVGLERSAAAAQKSGLRKFSCYGSQRSAPSLGRLAPKLSSKCKHLSPAFCGVNLHIAPAALDLHARGPLAVSRGLQLGNKPRLLILMKRAGDLPHHDPRRTTTVGQVIAIRGQNAHTAVGQGQDAQLLGDQLASEAARILDDHSPHAIALDLIKQRSEASATLDLVCT